MIALLLLLAAPDAGVQAPPPQPELAPLAAPDVGDIAPLVPPAPEYTLSLKDADFRVQVTFRPGDPDANKLVELSFDIARGEGDGQPWIDGKLALAVSGPGPKARYLVRALGDAGSYGVHWTPPARGLWTLTLAPYKEAGPSVTFQVGVGVPMPASAQGHMVQTSRTVVGAARPASSDGPAVKQLMAELGRRWVSQADLTKPEPAELKAMAKLMKAIQGRVPREHAAQSTEFDTLAARETAQLEQGGLPSAESCLQCHYTFRDDWVKPWPR